MVSNTQVMLPIDNLNPRNLWPVLPELTRLYILVLFLVSVYITASLMEVLLRLRSLKRRSRERSQEAVRPTLASLQARLASLRQVLFSLCLLFGLCFLLQIPAAFNVIGDSNVPALTIIFMQLNAYISYATDVLLVFVVLHLAQWLVWAHVQSFAKSERLN
jgi:hypothetical protein